MKKLMIAAAIVCAAALAQASSYDWNAATSFISKPGATNPMLDGVTGTAYLFDANVYAQTLLVSDLQNGVYGSVAAAFAAKGVKDINTTAPAPTLAISGGNAGASDRFEYTQGLQTFYAVVVDSAAPDRVYVTAPAQATGSTMAGDPSNINIGNEFVSSMAPVKTGGYEGAGWYQTVPEPTSGLLLLLGVAGLALKRKRA